MFLCDPCGAKLVLEKKIKPLNEIWGANNIPWKKGKCNKCELDENLMQYPDYLIKKEKE